MVFKVCTFGTFHGEGRGDHCKGSNGGFQCFWNILLLALGDGYKKICALCGNLYTYIYKYIYVVLYNFVCVSYFT